MLLATGFTSAPISTTRETFIVTVVTATATAADNFDDSRLPFKVVRRPGFRQLLRLIEEADLVHLAGPCLLPLAISWLIRKPVVIVHHGYQSICPNGLLFKQPSQSICPGHFMQGQYAECLHCCAQTMGAAAGFRSLLLTFARRWLCKRAAFNVSVTNHVKARVQLPRGRTIYHGIDVIESIDLQSSQSGVLEFAYVGRLVAEKGLKSLLHAAKHLSDRGRSFKLTFIGDGPERACLEKMTHDLKLDRFARFTGALRGAELDRAVSSAAAVVMPSIWEEAAGMSAIEQMMRGRLVIAADIGGLGEIVGDVGLKFAVGDSQELASCMQRATDDPGLVRSLGSAARNRAMRLFDRKGMIESQIDLCRELLRR